jgi:hypothetical protein
VGVSSEAPQPEQKRAFSALSAPHVAHRATAEGYAPRQSSSKRCTPRSAGRLIGMVLMLVGIGFLSLLTASVASRFVKQERGEEHVEVMEALRRIEADVAELKSRL